MTTPVNSSIILSTNPIFAFVFAALILKERITFLKRNRAGYRSFRCTIIDLQNGKCLIWPVLLFLEMFFPWSIQ